MDTILAFKENMQDVIKALAHFVWLKLVISSALVVVAYLVGADHLPLVCTLTVLVGIDLITGTYAAYKLDEPITSRKMVKTAIKWTLYMLMVSASYMTDQLIPGNWYIVQVALAFLGVTELVSILENIGKAGVAIPLKLLNRLEKFRDGQ